MVAFSAIKEGDILWDCRRTRQGNTSLRRMSSWQVKIITIDHDKKTAVASWNWNAPRTYTVRQIEKLRRTRVQQDGDR